MRKFVFALLIPGTAGLVIGEVQSHGKANTLASTGFLILIVALLIPFFAWLARSLCRCFRGFMDCVWVLRRGVLNPIQVRQEFIATMDRDPTMQEVHDLYAMIQSEYNQALISLGAVVGGSYLVSRALHGEGL